MSEQSKSEIGLTKIILIGLAFATTGVFWTHFNGFVPPLLEDALILEFGPEFKIFGLVGILGITGFIMGWDNILGFFIQPYIGARSDRTRTRFGRRMPYILIGATVASIFFVLIPIAGEMSIWYVIPVILIFNLSMALYRSPAVGLMPDFVPSKKRSVANGIVNLMGGIGATIMLIFGSSIKKNVGLTASFAFGSIVAILMLVLLFLTIKESQDYVVREQVNLPGITSQFKELIGRNDKSGVYMLLSIFFWFLAWNAIEASFTLYGERILGVLDADAQAALVFFSVPFILMAIPAGIIGQKIGRIRTMKLGLLLFIASLVVASTIQDLGILRFILLFCGTSWALINVNSIVVIWEHALDNGSGTGLYYGFSTLAAVTGPFIVGTLADSLTYSILFPFSALTLVVSFLLILFVKTGETGEVDKSVYLEAIE